MYLFQYNYYCSIPLQEVQPLFVHEIQQCTIYNSAFRNIFYHIKTPLTEYRRWEGFTKYM